MKEHKHIKEPRMKVLNKVNWKQAQKNEGVPIDDFLHFTTFEQET